MKNLLLIVGGVVLGLAVLLGTVSIAPVKAISAPVECTGMVFDHIIVGTSFGSVLNGTSGRDLIIGVGGDIIKGNGGNDCLVSGGLSIVKGGAGNDVLVGSTTSSEDVAAGDILDGGAGHDSCTGDEFSSEFINCE